MRAIPTPNYNLHPLIQFTRFTHYTHSLTTTLFNYLRFFFKQTSKSIKMQFSTIFSIATLVAAVAAAPSCNSPTQQNACAARTDGHNVAACCTMLHAGGKEICQSIASIGMPIPS
jgi:hypothetical protein